MNTKEFGQIAERKFALECAKLGLVISQPLGDTAPYDFIVDFNGVLVRVQCKSMQKLQTSYTAQSHKKQGHRRTEKVSYKGLIDYFFFYNLEDDLFVFIHVDECADKQTSFSEKKRSYKHYAKIQLRDRSVVDR